MWTRKELKARGKAAFLANYWKCVLAALILALISGGLSYRSSTSRPYTSDSSVQMEDRQLMEYMAEQMEDMGGNALERFLFRAASRGTRMLAVRSHGSTAAMVGGAGLASLVLSILVFNPLIVGCYRFFLQNSRGPARLNELGAGFQDDWGNVILVMFLKNLFIALWSLLFIVPGFVKAYSYRMVPYLLEEHPELKGTQVITISRQMMNGHKGRAFVLDLSFLGWIILSALTFGILHLFWVGPYIQATDAQLYEAVKADYEARLAAGTVA
jgi:hypothetical protein